MFPAPSTDKRPLRRFARERAAAVDREMIAPRVAAQIATLPNFADAGHILLYLATDREIRVEDLALQFPAKSWYAPRCVEGGGLTIHPFHPDATPLIGGAFGLREPDAAPSPAITLGVLDLVLVPGLLFTAEGDRLGHGGGYYDRFLPRLSPRCFRVGVACETMMIDTLPRNPWDARVDAVVTEKQVYQQPPRVTFSKMEALVDKDTETP